VASINIDKFGGLMPSTSRMNLGAVGAQVAHNLLAGTTEFKPVQSDSAGVPVTVLNDHPGSGNGEARTLFSLERTTGGGLNTGASKTWIATSDYRSYARVQIKDDTKSRTCYTFDDTYAAGTDTSPMVFSTDIPGGKKLGVPAPKTPPTVKVLSNKVFDAEAREGLVSSKVSEIVDLVKSKMTKVQVGSPMSGWAKTNGYIGYIDSNTKNAFVARVFAMDGNPSMNITKTYCTAGADKFSWILDPAAGAWYAQSRTTGNTEYPLPSWQLASTWHLCLSFRCHVDTYTIDTAALSTEIKKIEVSVGGATVATKLFTSDKSDALAGKVKDYIDGIKEKVSTKIGELEIKVNELKTMLDRGVSDINDTALSSFYQRPDIIAEIDEAANDFVDDFYDIIVKCRSITGYNKNKSLVNSGSVSGDKAILKASMTFGRGVSATGQVQPAPGFMMWGPTQTSSWEHIASVEFNTTFEDYIQTLSTGSGTTVGGGVTSYEWFNDYLNVTLDPPFSAAQVKLLNATSVDHFKSYPGVIPSATCIV